jgi:hypothetical protein
VTIRLIYGGATPRGQCSTSLHHLSRRNSTANRNHITTLSRTFLTLQIIALDRIHANATMLFFRCANLNNHPQYLITNSTLPPMRQQPSAVLSST